MTTYNKENGNKSDRSGDNGRVSARGGWLGQQDRQRTGGDILARRRADSGQELPGLPPARGSGADVAADVSGNSAVGEGDSRSRHSQTHAAVVRGSALRQIFQRPLVVAVR